MAEEQGNALPAVETPTSPQGGQSADTTPVTSGADSSEATEVQEQASPKAPSSSSKSGGKKEPKVNLYQSEEFRRYQATQNRQIEEERQRRMALEAQIREQQLKGMNDYEKAQFRAQEAERQAQELEQRLKMKELEDIKRQDMQRLHDRTGIPIDMLESATSFDEAQNMALEYMESNLESTIEERVTAALEAKLANRTDIGGGKPEPVKSQAQELRETATETRNSVDFVKSLFLDED